MPIYEYRCQDCGHQFERRMKMSDDNPPCPKPDPHHDYQTDGTYEPAPCGGETVKQISRTSFVLKGGGWAKDGY